MAVVEALETHLLAQRAAKPGLAQRQLDTKQGVARTRLDTKSDIDPLVSLFTIDVSLMLIAFVFILTAAL